MQDEHEHQGDEAAAGQPAPRRRGDIARYPVRQPDGHVRHQVILITGHSAEGRARGVPLGYEHEQAEFAHSDLLD